jgi:hypothetical protein
LQVRIGAARCLAQLALAPNVTSTLSTNDGGGDGTGRRLIDVIYIKVRYFGRLWTFHHY